MSVIRTLTLQSVVLAVLFAQGATAQTATYPAKPITLVIPFSPKSEADGVGRGLMEFIKPHFPEAEFLAENRPGDSGAKAAQDVRLSPSDGLTLLVGTTSPIAVAPAFKPALPYRWSDFTILGVLSVSPLICSVPSSSPYRNTREMLAAVRKSPLSFRHGHTGPGSILNLATLYLFKLGGVAIKGASGVSFAGTGDAIAALGAGEIDLVCGTAGTMMPAIQAGKIRPLFTTAAGRLRELPELKNAREAGFPNMSNCVAWTVLAGPSGLPAPVIAKWKKALASLGRDPAWKAEVEKRGSFQALGTALDNVRFVREQFELYDKLVTSLGLRE